MGVLDEALRDSRAAATTDAAPGDGGDDAKASVDASVVTTTEAGASVQPTGDAQAAQAATATPPVTTATAQNLDEDGLPDNHPVPRKALLEERRKRQEMERQYAETQRQLAEAQGKLSTYAQFAPQPQQTPKPNPDVDFYGNPVAFVQDQLKGVEQKFTKQLDERAQAYENNRLAMSAAMVRQQFPDYDEVIESFKELSKAAPYLADQAVNNPHPALFAYQQAKAYREATKYGSNIDEVRAKIREEEKAKLEAERANAEAEAKKQASLTAAAQANTSTAGARGTGASTRAAPKMRDNPLKEALAR
jgi:hypothetical protein